MALSNALKTLASLGLAACVLACEPPSETVENGANNGTTQVADESAATEFLQSLPSPLHVARVFKRNGIKYVPGIAHDFNKVDAYVSNQAKALNLGTYSTDLAYTILNDQNQEALNYFKAVRALAEALNLNGVAEKDNIAERFENNLGNADSLVRLVADLHMESEFLLKATDRHDVVFLSFAGALTESMYLATRAGDAQRNPEIANRLLEQKNSIIKLMDVLATLPEAGDITWLVDGLKAVDESMIKLASVNRTTEEPLYWQVYEKEVLVAINTLRDQIVTKS